MESLPAPITKITSLMPDRDASSTAYCTNGLSMMGSISLGCALVAGRKRVPRPATGNTALRILISYLALNISFGMCDYNAGWRVLLVLAWRVLSSISLLIIHGGLGSFSEGCSGLDITARASTRRVILPTFLLNSCLSFS